MPGVEKWIPEPKIDSRIKDEAKIASAREEKIVEAVARAGLDPDLAQIKLITWMIGTLGPAHLTLVNEKKMSKAVKTKAINKLVDELESKVSPTSTNSFPFYEIDIMTEVEAINQLWGALVMCSGWCVGYNILNFDLPLLQRRSFDLGLKPAITPRLSKYQTEPICDLYGILFNWSWDNTKKLKWLAKRYGLEILAPEVDGSMVAEMSDAELVLYGYSDLLVTVQLYNKMNGIYFVNVETNE
jgi:hypothetical protein